MTSAIRHLYIDDEPSIRELTVQEIGRRGFDVTVAATGEEGLALFRKNPYPLVTTDLKMPGIDGFAILADLRDNPDRAITPTIVLSASSDPDDIRLAYQLGANSYIVKPVDL